MRRDLTVTLVTPSPAQYYSGMLPGWMSGHYRPEEWHIDVRTLARRAGITIVQAALTEMNANERRVTCSDGRCLSYDWLSLDVGGENDSADFVACGPRLITIKPLSEFTASWQQVVIDNERKRDFRIAIIGGGAAGVELALAAKHALSTASPTADVILVTGRNGLLPQHNMALRRRVLSQLQRSGIPVIQQQAQGSRDGIMLEDGQCLSADRIILATGSRAPAWLSQSRLKLDPQGFVAVDAAHRSLSHPTVFAAGDVCARDDVRMPRSGVHAVRAGPVLAHNLLAVLDARDLIEYRPRRRTLYLLACGDRYGIASWGSWSAEGCWVWYWKRAIDRRFIARFRSTAT